MERQRHYTSVKETEPCKRKKPSAPCLTGYPTIAAWMMSYITSTLSRPLRKARPGRFKGGPNNVTSRSRRSAAPEMARRHKKVIWTKQGYSTLDGAVTYVAEDSLTAAQQLLEIALDTAESLSVFDERGRIVPELQQPNVRELLVQPAHLRSVRYKGRDLGSHSRCQRFRKVAAVFIRRGWLTRGSAGNERHS